MEVASRTWDMQSSGSGGIQSSGSGGMPEQQWRKCGNGVQEMAGWEGVDGSFFVHLLPCQFDLLGRVAPYLTGNKNETT
ncbi:MAG TPA: hypothetical protein VI233_18420 [Puia sp.]